MNTKLTLTMDESVIEKAKKYANKRNRSLSGLIENYLISLTKETTEDEIQSPSIEISPLVKSLKGSFTMPKDMDYQVELSNRLKEKYL